MKVKVEIWCDNHGKDETFGTKPNEPHFITEKVENGDDVFKTVIIVIRRTLKLKDNEPIHIQGYGEDGRGNLVVRMKIAESEFVCSAKVVM